MSPDTHTDDGLDAFEAALAARMGAATDTITGDGVTRHGVDARIAARRRSRTRRQGGLVLAAAALVIAAGIGALALGADEPSADVKAGPGDSTTTAVPTTEERETTSVPASTTTTPPSTPPETAPVPTTAPPPSTTEAPPETTSTTTTPSTTTVVTTTTAPTLTPGRPCTPGSSPDCIDPEGDGSHVYLLGGAACMASPIGGSQCADLDGDGYAGYPDGQ